MDSRDTDEQREMPCVGCGRMVRPEDSCDRFDPICVECYRECLYEENADIRESISRSQMKDAISHPLTAIPARMG